MSAQGSPDHSVKVEVFLMCYNRAKYAAEALQSILDQAYPHIHILISDNSTTDEVEAALRPMMRSNCTYIRRKPSLPPLEHFNTVLTSVEAPYFMIFHDDDLMMKDCVKTLMFFAQNNPDATAVAPNALEFTGEYLGEKAAAKTSHNLFNRSLTNDIDLTSFDELAERYLDFRSGVNPFPGYLIKNLGRKRPLIRGRFGRKYSDVSFLLELIRHGKFIWLHQAHMLYRRHGANDSNRVDIKGVLFLRRYILRNSSKASSIELANQYTCGLILSWLFQTKAEQPRRYRKLLAQKAFGYALTHPGFTAHKMARIFLKKALG